MPILGGEAAAQLKEASPETKVARLLDYFDREGIRWHPQIEVCCQGQTEHEGNGAIGVYLASSCSFLSSGTVLVQIPKRSCLSPRTSCLAPFLGSGDIFSVESGCGLTLAVCLVAEYLQGPKSRFCDYCQALPHERAGGTLGITLPLEWAADSIEQQCLRGTEAARILGRAARRLSLPAVSTRGLALCHVRDYFDRVGLTLLRQACPGIASMSNVEQEKLASTFIGAWSLVSSRAFVCDTYHGLVLAPFADLFNHADENQVQFECTEVVCMQCGLQHIACPMASETPAKCTEGTMGGVPAVDSDDTADMILCAPLFRDDAESARVEIFNSYGPLSNARLLVRYGFSIEDGTDYERITWDWTDEDERAEMLQSMGLTGDQLAAGSRLGSWCRLFADYIGSDWSRSFEEQLLSSVTVNHLKIGAVRPPKNYERQRWHADKFHLLGRQAPPAIIIDGHDLLVSLLDDDVEGAPPQAEIDRDFPLCVDGEGKISVALWRAACLAAVAKDRDEPGSTPPEDVRKSLRGIETLATALGDDPTMASDLPNHVSHHRLWLRRALEYLDSLLRRRQEEIPTYSASGSQAALVCQYGESGADRSLRSVVQCALVEEALLRVARCRVSELLCRSEPVRTAPVPAHNR
ncbi:unnamed protein product [Parajaminaea phylloscopi]